MIHVPCFLPDASCPVGTSFIFSRDQPLCKVLHFDVGILTPDWLANSTNLGQMETDTFVCDVWTKAGGSVASGVVLFLWFVT
jgi:hypothetical protein